MRPRSFSATCRYKADGAKDSTATGAGSGAGTAARGAGVTAPAVGCRIDPELPALMPLHP